MGVVELNVGVVKNFVRALRIIMSTGPPQPSTGSYAYVRGFTYRLDTV